MECEYSISLDKIIKEFQLEILYIPRPAEEILISNTEVNRPGLALAGFFGNFEASRIEVLGKAEHNYLAECS